MIRVYFNFFFDGRQIGLVRTDLIHLATLSLGNRGWDKNYLYPLANFSTTFKMVACQ